MNRTVPDPTTPGTYILCIVIWMAFCLSTYLILYPDFRDNAKHIQQLSELGPNSSQSGWHYAQYCARTVMAKEYFGYTLPETATPPYKKEFVGAIVGPIPDHPLTYRCSVHSTLELHDQSIVKWLARLHSDTGGTDWFLDSFDFFDGRGKTIKSSKSVKKL